MTKKEAAAPICLKKSDLVKVGEEMNELLACDPPINTSLPATLLEKEIVESAALVDPADPFTESTWKILGQLANVFPGATTLEDNGEDLDPEEDEGDEGDLDQGNQEDQEGEEDRDQGDEEDPEPPVQPAKKEKPAPAAKKEATEPKKPAVRKTLWVPGTELKVVRAGSKLAAALDIMKAKKFKGCRLEDFESLGWNLALAKAYICYDINKLGYGSRFYEDGSFDLILPDGCSMPAHKEK